MEGRAAWGPCRRPLLQDVQEVEGRPIGRRALLRPARGLSRKGGRHTSPGPTRRSHASAVGGRAPGASRAARRGGEPEGPGRRRWTTQGVARTRRYGSQPGQLHSAPASSREPVYILNPSWFATRSSSRQVVTYRILAGGGIPHGATMCDVSGIMPAAHCHIALTDTHGGPTPTMR